VAIECNREQKTENRKQRTEPTSDFIKVFICRKELWVN
jgi:hypothetical protein